MLQSPLQQINPKQPKKSVYNKNKLCYHYFMNKQQREQFEKDLQTFGDKYSLTRIKTESVDFDHDYTRGEDTIFHLVSLKAVIRTLGKTTKTKIGENEEHQTYESAYEAARAYWSEYFQLRRDRRTDKEKRGEAKRQKRYREKRRAEAEELSQRQ